MNCKYYYLIIVELSYFGTYYRLRCKLSQNKSLENKGLGELEMREVDFPYIID